LLDRFARLKEFTIITADIHEEYLDTGALITGGRFRMVTKKQKDVLQEILLAELRDLEERNRKNVHEMEDSMANQRIEGDEADQSAFIEQRNRLIRLRDRDRKMINKIQSTLKKFQNDTYGICDSCGLEISHERLKTRPVAALCIECKLEQEEREERDKAIRRR
jgi:DnaK suppressor protein